MDCKERRRVVLRLARKLVEVVAPCLRPEERWDAFQEFAMIIERDLDRFEAKLRTGPSEPSTN
jgi:hypothetical protein